MKRMTVEMNDDILIQALRHMAPETGSLHCLGCGYEHGCSLHGCAVIKRSAERLEQLTESKPNNQLTLAELEGMDKEPVWNDTMKKWVIVDLYWEHGPRTVDAQGRWRDLEDRYYRRKPEEGAT